MRRTILLSVLCLAGALLNIVINILASRAFGLPLYLDTILTISLTLTGGLFWGLLTGAFTNLIGPTLYFSGWEGYLFVICNMTTALLTWLFCRFFPRELNLSVDVLKIPQTSQRLESRRLSGVMNRIVVLILLSFCLCLAMSVLGGILTAFIQSINPSLAGKPGLSADLSATMFGQNMPVFLVEILSRIPVNIIDRLISVFAGFGIAVVLSKREKREEEFYHGGHRVSRRK